MDRARPSLSEHEASTPHGQERRLKNDSDGFMCLNGRNDLPAWGNSSLHRHGELSSATHARPSHGAGVGRLVPLLVPLRCSGALYVQAAGSKHAIVDGPAHACYSAMTGAQASLSLSLISRPRLFRVFPNY